MTYQQKFDELQTLFSQRFDANAKLQKKFSLKKSTPDQFLKTKTEFEKLSIDFQNFLILFRESNASPNDEFGATGQRCTT